MKSPVVRKILTSKETARLLGVSEASVKRWADGGLLPVQTTVGGHRRFRPEDVAAFRRTHSRRVRAGFDGKIMVAQGRKQEAEARRERASAITDEEQTAKLFDTLVGGHSDEASAILVNLYLHGHTMASIADSALCPAMRFAGDLWHDGKLTVAEEHIATRTALKALSTLRKAMDIKEANGLAAICCSVEEDFHEMPVHVSASLLEAEGWEAFILGTSTPFSALAEAVTRFAPHMVCVASTILGPLDRAAREYKGFRDAAKEVGAVVALGGAGFAGEILRRRFPAELHADSFGQLESFAIALAGEHERSE